METSSQDVKRIITNEVINHKPNFTPFTLMRSINRQFRDICDQLGNPAVYDLPLHVILNYFSTKKREKCKDITLNLCIVATTSGLKVPIKPSERSPIKTAEPKTVTVFLRLRWFSYGIFKIYRQTNQDLQFFMHSFDLDFVKLQIEACLLSGSKYNFSDVKYIPEPLIWYEIASVTPNCDKVRLLAFIRQTLLNTIVEHSTDLRIDVEKLAEECKTAIGRKEDNDFLPRKDVLKWVLGRCEKVHPTYLLWVFEDQKHTEDLINAINNNSRVSYQLDCNDWELGRLSFKPGMSLSELTKCLTFEHGIQEHTETFSVLYKRYIKKEREIEMKRLEKEKIDTKSLLREKFESKEAFIKRAKELGVENVHYIKWLYINNVINEKEEIKIRNLIKEKMIDKFCLLEIISRSGHTKLGYVIDFFLNNEINPTKNKIEIFCEVLGIKSEDIEISGLPEYKEYIKETMVTIVNEKLKKMQQNLINND